MPSTAGPSPTDPDWPGRVRRLEAEIAGLKRAMRSRGLIEQAKGMLAERLGCHPEAAFDYLAAASQRQNIPVINLAADIVGITVADLPRAEDPVRPSPAPTHPPAGAAAPPQLRTTVGLAAPSPGGLPTRLARVLRRGVASLNASDSLASVAQCLVATGTRELGGTAAAIFAAEPDGAVSLLASHGWPPQVASEWRRAPTSINTTVATVLRTGRPLLLDGFTDHDFVLVGPGPTRVVYPLVAGRRVAGALALIWPEAREFTHDERVFLDRLATAAGRAIRRHWPATGGGGPAEDDSVWLRTVLDTVHGHGHVLRPIRNGAGTVTDFTILASSRRTRETDGDTTGRRLLDIYPQLAMNGIFDAYAKLATDQAVFEQRAVPEETVIDGRPRHIVVNRRASKLGDEIIAAWERIDETLDRDTRMSRMEGLARLGWAEWDLRAGDAIWSAGLFRLTGRDPERGPTKLDRFPDLFVPGDRRAVRALLTAIEAGRPRVEDLRLAGPAGPVPVRVFGEAEISDDGPWRLRLVLQDVTEQRAAEERWARSESKAAARQLRLAQELGVTQGLGEALYPRADVDVATYGARAVGRHHAAERTGTLRGDFCDARVTDSGDLLIVTGDMFGIGLAAAATVVRIRYPAAALGLVGTPPDRILSVLNEDLLGDPAAPLASLVIGRFDPRTRELAYAVAGHLPPLLLRGGTPTLLDSPTGPTLGLMEDAGYELARIRLRPGDVIACYTDGLVDQHGGQPLAEFARRAAAAHAAQGLSGLLELATPVAGAESCLLALAVDSG